MIYQLLASLQWLSTKFKTWNRNYYLVQLITHCFEMLKVGVGGGKVRGEEGDRGGQEESKQGDSVLFFSSFYCKATRAPIQFARHMELSLNLSNALTGKAVTSHMVIWTQSTLQVIYRSHPSHIHYYKGSHNMTPHHAQRPRETIY